ncbi:MAG TPA: autotransporter assembly complex family protein [Kiloniellales bacterium]
MAILLAACDTLRDLGIVAADRPGEDRGEIAVPEPESTGTLAYTARIAGIAEAHLQALLNGTSQLISLQGRPVAAVGTLRRRADGDVERLQTALRSEGFYAAEVRYQIDSTADPIQVTVEVAPGPQYLLADYTIDYEGAPPPPPEAQPTLEDLGLHIGMAARAPDIVAAQRRLLDDLARRGHPLARVVDRKTFVTEATTTMTVTLTVDAGPAARFGAVTIEGLSRVKDNYVRDLLAWEKGATYDRDAVEKSRTALSATGLFTTVEIAPASAVEADGTLPVTVSVTEGRHRSIGFGANYSTSEGFGGEVFWEHRNLLGRNESLRLSLTAAEIEQSLKAQGRKPGFLRPDQALLAETALTNRNTDAFDEQSVTGSIGVERPLPENWRATAGVSAEYSILTDEEGRDSFRLFGLPLSGWRDTTDSLLDPTRGTRLNLSLTPYGGGGDGTLLFAVATAGGSAYTALDADQRFVLAGRLKLGSLVGEETPSVPANKRFYAGGGGSVRGYAFQAVGPLDDQNDPLGGRSLVEVSGEVRVRITDSVGIVPFIDGGSVFDASYPDFSETIRWAGGLGIRYFSGIGPLRLDVAVPINKRSSDDSFQFYISLGQAF